MDTDPFDELRRGLQGELAEAPERRWPDVRRLLLAGAGVVALAIGVVVTTAGRTPPPVAELPPAPSTTGPVPGASSDDLPDPPTAARVWPAEPVEIAGTEVRTGGNRWSVGQPGDLIAVGDWGCNGTKTPAVVRPGDGRLYVFDGWATADAPLAASPGPTVPPGVTGVEASGCGQATVRTADGASLVVAVAPPP